MSQKFSSDGLSRRRYAILFLGLTGAVLLGCGIFSPMRWIGRSYPRSAWGEVSFTSNGERIYFTATNEAGEAISNRGGPAFGGMMMQPRLACVSCHGSDGRGGRHVMHMQVMDAPDIRYASLASEVEHGSSEAGMDHGEGEYDLDIFRQAVVEGKHPNGEALSTAMPRWKMSAEDLAAIFDYLKSLP